MMAGLDLLTAEYRVGVERQTLSDASHVHDVVVRDLAGTEVLRFPAIDEKAASSFVVGLDALVRRHTLTAMEVLS